VTSTEITTADLLKIADTMCRYSEAMDLIGANPVQPGDPDPALDDATELLRSCLTGDAVIRLFFEGRTRPPVPAGAGGPVAFAAFVRQCFTDYRCTQTYHLAGNIRITPAGPDTVRSYINSTHWMADGRLPLAPIEYHDTVTRCPDGLWRITERDIHVWQW